MYSFRRQTERSPIDSSLDPRADPKYFNYTWTNFMDYYEPLQPENVINLSYPDNWGQSNMHSEIDIQELVSKKYPKIYEWWWCNENFAPNKEVEKSSLSNAQQMGWKYASKKCSLQFSFLIWYLQIGYIIK